MRFHELELIPAQNLRTQLFDIMVCHCLCHFFSSNINCQKLSENSRRTTIPLTAVLGNVVSAAIC